MADRFKHEDGLKAQEVDLRGKKLQRRLAGRQGHEAYRHAARGENDTDKRGMTTRRNEKIEKAAGDMASKPRQKGVSGYTKSKKDVYKELDEALK